MRENDESPCPTLRPDIMDLFEHPPEPLGHLSFTIDAMGIPLLIATVPSEDRADLGLDRPLPMYPQPDPSPSAVLHRVAARMLKSMKLRRAPDDQLTDDDKVFPDFANPELLKSVNDFREAMEAIF
ncbi:hypothetical protein GS397_10230 [Sphingobium yanoikuyae]|uniref:Uncharacterized protein n=1 Tax=Sphingobium yanoikuyae TaxID=13690 RepID=A0A6P1GII8_SPHYA|nr:hypothetical protein [Sphingobium yanoikuyae]QHD67391.1 hypothetical protein GS397_10230 [Sphingobium yanoikuyae]